MKKAINVALGLASAALAITLLTLILLCAGVFGRSAYSLAVKNGFKGTEQQWLESLKGESGANGTNGVNGKSAYELYVENVPEGETALTQEEWLNSLSGAAGQRGSLWFSGNSEPTDVEGARDGDFYLQIYSDFASKRGFAIYTIAGGNWSLVADMSTDVSGDEQANVKDYHIRNNSDLNAFLSAVSGTEETHANDFTGKTVYLDYSLNLTSADWAGIGSESTPFKGTFDGQGHSVTLKRTASKERSLAGNGFFNYLDPNAQIVNLTLHVVTEGAEDFPYVSHWDENSTQNEYFEVTSAKGLETFRDQVNGGETFAKQTVKLGKDIDLKSFSNWEPIGTSENSFQGTFDGDGHIISNLTCTSEGDYVGLFGYSSKATFKDLTIDGATLHGTGYIGALLGGSFPSGRIDNVAVSNVTATGNHYIGGIVGAGYITVENCKAHNIDITATPNLVGDNAYDNGDKIGGIAGQIREYDTIHNCKVDGVKLYGYRDMGGIAGYAYSSPSTHMAKNVSITVDQSKFYEYKPTNIGGIFGYTTQPSAESAVENVSYTLQHIRATTSEQFVALLNLVNTIKPTKTVIGIKRGTFEASANEQFKVEADNVAIEGAGEDNTIIDARNFSCSEQAGFVVSGNNFYIAKLTVRATPSSNSVAVMKVTSLNDETTLVKNFTLSHVKLVNNSTGAKGHGLNLHGVDGARIKYLNVENYDKCAISVAKAKNVTIANSDFKDDDNTNWANIGFMYSANSFDAYRIRSEVTIDFDTCTFGENSQGVTLIYSERPKASHDAKVDLLYDVNSGLINNDNAPDGWTYAAQQNGAWTLTQNQSSSGSELQKN